MSLPSLLLHVLDCMAKRVTVLFQHHARTTRFCASAQSCCTCEAALHACSSCKSLNKHCMFSALLNYGQFSIIHAINLQALQLGFEIVHSGLLSDVAFGSQAVLRMPASTRHAATWHGDSCYALPVIHDTKHKKTVVRSCFFTAWSQPSSADHEVTVCSCQNVHCF